MPSAAAGSIALVEKYFNDLNTMSNTETQSGSADWPAPLSRDAYYGLAGEFTDMVAPHSEADPAALMTQFLVCSGNVFGRGPYWQVESTPHFSNLFAAIVGVTAKGRKGTSFDNVSATFEGIDKKWTTERIAGGLSSGEGLIWAVRDPVREMVPKKEKGMTRYEEQETDPGVADKRLLVVEAEFARVLSVTERDGNTLSPVIRNAWDGKILSILTKRQAAKCSEPHISIVVHITQEELLRMLSDTAIANGFANRFLFVCARRSQLLPFGGAIRELDWEPFRRRLDCAVEKARDCSLMSLTSLGREKWAAVYGPLSQGADGMLGAVTSRAEAQVMRLAMLYALLDSQSEIDIQHLKAGLEVWRYCLDSCRFIFGNSLGDPTADEIVKALRNSKEGLTRKEISDLFQRHKSSSLIQGALNRLQQKGIARFQKEETGGRPTERWFLIS